MDISLPKDENVIMDISLPKESCANVSPYSARATALYELLLMLTGVLASSLTVTWVNYAISTAVLPDPLLLASMGAAAVLFFGMIHAPAAQPRNVILGTLIAVTIGLACRTVSSIAWAMASLAITLTIMLMHLTGALYPPGGAIALLFTYLRFTDGEWCIVKDLETNALGRFVDGCRLALHIVIGTTTLLCTAILVNKLKPTSKPYPVKGWW